MQIGVCGLGVVGKAVFKAFNKIVTNRVVGFDIRNSPNDFEDLLGCEVVFLCLPTPTHKRTQNLDAIRTTLENLSRGKFRGTVCIKSTILPGTTKRFAKEFPELSIAHNPEFLTERNAEEDFMEQAVVLISSMSDVALGEVIKAYKTIGDFQTIGYENPDITEMAKYMHNCYLATKVALMNEFFNECDAMETPFDLVVQAAVTQGRLAINHTQVPGPDGQFGYGGSCFPKDMEALSEWGHFSILEAVQESNRNQRMRRATVSNV